MRKSGVRASAQYVLALALVSIAMSGQPAGGASACSGDVPFRPAISPYEVTPETLKTLWADLGISAKLRPSWSGKLLAAPKKIDCATDCESAIVTGDRLLPEGDDVVLRVCKHFEETCRFLLLHHDARGWGLVDYLDAPFEKYEIPAVSIEAAQDRRWLLKSGLVNAGTGMYFTVWDWFEMRCGTLRRVLTVARKGDDVNARPARNFTARFKDFHRQGGSESLEFAYILQFEDYNDNLRLLWQEERTVVFSRTDTNKPFVFDPAASNISAAFKDKVFAADSMNESDFVEFAYDRLLKIAGDPGDQRREWLRRFLAELPESEKVDRLEALLDK